MIHTRVSVCIVALSLAGAVACGSTSKSGAPPAAQAPAQPAATATASPDANAFTGTVAETVHAGGYTYARLQTAGKDDVWIAATEFPAKTGDRLSVALEMPMQNFESKTLTRTFPLIYFVSSVTRDGQTVLAEPAHGTAPAMMPSHGPSAAPATVEPIAPAAGSISIADVWAKRTSLAGKQVIVRGKVVKVNTAILDRNWIHLQDGSGSAADHTNDLTVTSTADVKVGDIVIVTGVLAVGKDFGAGYAYDAILENAKITK
jgi:hypothetical protein